MTFQYNLIYIELFNRKEVEDGEAEKEGKKEGRW